MLITNILRKKGLFDNHEDLKQEIKNRFDNLKLKGHDDIDIEFNKDDTQIERLNLLQEKLTELESQQPEIKLIRNYESDLISDYTPKETPKVTKPAKRKSYNSSSDTTQIQIKKDILRELSSWSKKRKLPTYLALETLIKMMLDDEILQSKLIDKYVAEYMKV